MWIVVVNGKNLSTIKEFTSYEEADKEFKKASKEHREDDVAIYIADVMVFLKFNDAVSN